MSLKAFYAAFLSVLATIIALSVVWEFWLEDWLLPSLVSHHDVETRAERLEFVATAAFFSFIALIGPAVIGTRIILRDRILRQTVTRLSQEDSLTGLNNRRRYILGSLNGAAYVDARAGCPYRMQIARLNILIMI